MKTIRFENGDQMPIIGLGTWKAAKGEVYTAAKEAIRIGYRHIDCASIYGNETGVGQALAESISEGIVSRDQLWITSKLWNNAHAPDAVQPALEKTLSDLHIEYIDLYLIHWPVVLRDGVIFHKSAEDLIDLEALPISKTWQALETMVEKGICRHIGVSNFSITKLMRLLDSANVKPEMNQIELHPYLQQPAMLEFCSSNAIHLTAFAPLGSGDRPARIKVDGEPILLKDPTIISIAAQHNITPAQVLISWAIQRQTAVLPKSVNSDRLKENLNASQVTLTQADVQKISGLDCNHRYINGNAWVVDGGPYTLSNLWDE